MTKLTKLALEQINTRLAAENEGLRKQVADLRMDLSIAQSSAPARSTKPAYVMPEWQAQRAQAMAAAKALAMSHGVAVKV